MQLHACEKQNDVADQVVIIISLNSFWGLFLESPGNFSSPKSCSTFAVFAFKIKVSTILKMIQ